MIPEFDMTNLGLLHYFLGVQIIQNDHGIFISQEKYICDLLKKFNMTTKTNEHFYRSIVGGLMYLTHTHLDILFSIGMISRFMHSRSVHHLRAAKKILQYVCDTINYGILYQLVTEFIFFGYSNSDWAGSIDDRKVQVVFISALVQV
ncbi:unnamed protein product [Spirodela intermedia]|uniref:Reverse transcriptase Ty1/copia-type domain-containing protein n=1 Tax=Spirodela intermedia TaxID=51605 RepID=A0A7I8LAB7_SPIIN|nr:unnamed protein product [Spirodela intermedia]